MPDFNIKTYDDKLNLYNKFFTHGYNLNENLSDKLKLIHLVCLVTFKMQQADPTINSKIVLERIFQKKLDNTREGLDDFLITLSIISQDFLYGVKKIDTLGYTNPKDIIEDIKKLVENWLPF